MRQKKKGAALSFTDINDVVNPDGFAFRHDEIFGDLDSLPRSTSMLVLELRSDGNSTMKEMSRMELLQIAQYACEEIETKLKMDQDLGLEMNQSASSWSPSKSKSKGLYLRPAFRGVQMRDLRKLDSAFTISNEPSIMVRKQAILVNADPIRALIVREACYIFVPDGADSLLSTLMTCFNEQSNEELCFEFKALETILSTLYRTFTADFTRIIPLIKTALHQLASNILSSGELETLRNLKNSVNEFHLQVCGLRRALMEILENEEDLVLLHLTKIYETPSLLKEMNSFDSEDVEILIESYLQDIHSTKTRIEMMQHRIQTTESVVMLKLDSTRNQLLTIDVVFGLIMTCFGLGTFVTGAFGMNLHSGVEEAEGWFWGIFGTLIGICTVSIVSIAFAFKKKGLIFA